MKVVLIMVMSLDGKTTLGSRSGASWASEEDQRHFAACIQESDIVVMGSNTYEAAKPFMVLSSSPHRIVMTHEPEKFSRDAVPGQLEFTDESPEALLNRLSSLKISKVLLVSGERLNAAFFDKELIQELWITVEPLIFGDGRGITTPLVHPVRLGLIDIEKLNPYGTLLLKYRVQHENTS